MHIELFEAMRPVRLLTDLQVHRRSSSSSSSNIFLPPAVVCTAVLPIRSGWLASSLCGVSVRASLSCPRSCC